MKAPRSRHVFRTKRRPSRWRHLGSALLLGSLGALLLVGLLQLLERLDTFLLLSNAIANLIGGLQQFLLGLVQLLAVVLVVVVVLVALVLVVAAAFRLVRAVLPRRFPVKKQT
ncbi:hypothetical protein [Aphanothece microscopica]